MLDSLHASRFGLVLALLGLLFGFGLGITFGVAEESLEESLDHSASAVLDSVYGGDQAKADRMTSRAWTYFKRAHLHAGGMGAVAVALILLTAAIEAGPRVRLATSLGLGSGALGYPLFWLLAGMRAPSLGSTDLAKESLAWLALPTSGLFTLAVVTVLALVVKKLFLR